MNDYKAFEFNSLDSNGRLKETILEVNKIVIWILSAVVVFYFINTLFILKLPLDYGFYRLLLLVISQVVSLIFLKKKTYKILAFFNISAFYIGFFIYPFLNISRRFEENIFMPLVLLIFGMTLPILFYSTKKDKKIIMAWLVLIFSTVSLNFYYQYSIASVDNLKFFALFIDYPMALIGFMAAIIFLGVLFYNYRNYNNEQHDTVLELNNSLSEKLIKIFELNNEKETQKEELQSIQEEMLAINDELERKVKKRSQDLRLRQKEIVRYAFMNSHILRAPIARIKGLMSISERLTDHREKEQIFLLIKESITELDNSSNSINEIINNSNDEQLRKIEQKVEQLYGGST